MATASLKTPILPAKEVQFRAVEGSPEIDARLQGDWHQGVRLQSCFPLSDPRHYVAVLAKGDEELAILDDVDALDPESREVANVALDRRYFTPEIERITVLKNEAGMWRFVVETQRGTSEFFVRNWRDSAFELSPGRWQIFSVDGGRYEIKQLDALDEGSLKLLDQLL